MRECGKLTFSLLNHSPSASAVLLVSMSSSWTSSTSSTVSAMTTSFPALASALKTWAASNFSLKSDAYSAFLNFAQSFSSYPSTSSEKSWQTHMSCLSVLGIALSSQEGFSVIMKLPQGLRVFSCLMTNLIFFSAVFLKSLANPMPLSFH